MHARDRNFADGHCYLFSQMFSRTNTVHQNIDTQVSFFHCGFNDHDQLVRQIGHLSLRATDQRKNCLYDEI